MRRGPLVRLALAVLILVASAYQATYSVWSVLDFVHRDQQARRPFDVGRLSDVVTAVNPEAERAGLKPDDRIAAIEGRAYRGYADLVVPVAAARPGDNLTVTLESGDTVTIALAPAHTAGATPVDWFEFIVNQIAMPLLCLSLGFWVALLRTEDPIAWILLFLMLSFSQINGSELFRLDGWWLGVSIVYRLFFTTTWPIWMMLFGINFPERLDLDRRFPWFKWTFIILISIRGINEIVLTLGAVHDFRSILVFDSLTRPFEIFLRVIYMAGISLFFMGLGIKMGTTKDVDARRRLILLTAGTTLSLLPTFILALRSLFFRVHFLSGVPEMILIPSIMMMFLFPLTLAYVIVVHRALDVRVVIRQGLQYALATRGVAVLQALTVLSVIGTMFLLLSRPDVRRVEILGVVSGGLLVTVLIGRIAERLRKWIDRRFFREAYDAERILSDLSEQVRTIVESGPLIETVARRIGESLHIDRVSFLVEESGRFTAAHTLGGGAPVALPGDAVIVARLRETDAPVRIQFDDPKAWVNKSPVLPPGDREALEMMGTRLLLPLSVRGVLIGIVSLGEKRSDEPYTGGDLRVLRSLATQTGLALENSRLTSAIATEVAHRERHIREVEIARDVQQRLFPQKLPPIDGLEYEGRCRPALGVGGDYFDFLALPGGRLGIAIADISGKGIGAALLMASLQASLRSQTLGVTGSLAEVVGTVNRLVYDASPDNRYATFFYGEYDPATRELTYVNAGHCHPTILRSDGKGGCDVIRLKTGGTVVGMFENTVYTEARIGLRPGDLMVAWSDGLSEALNPSEEEWGEQNVIRVAAACDGQPVSHTIERLIQGADAFAAGAAQYDDMTVVVLRVLPQGGQPTPD